MCISRRTSAKTFGGEFLNGDNFVLNDLFSGVTVQVDSEVDLTWFVQCVCLHILC
jgi:hypothetical protein